MLKSTRAVCFLILILNLCNQINSACEQNNECMCCELGIIKNYNGKGGVTMRRCNSNECMCCINNQWEVTNNAEAVRIGLRIANQQSTDYQTQQNLNFNINSDINPNQNRMQTNFQTRGSSTNQKTYSNAELFLPTTTKRPQAIGDFYYPASPAIQPNYNTFDKNQLNRNRQTTQYVDVVPTDNIQNINDNQKLNAVTDFSLNLLKEIKTDKNQNLIVSPISVQFLLLLLVKGAGGQTKSELKSKIGSSNGEDLLNILRLNGNGLKSALGIFHDKNIEIYPQYKRAVELLAQIKQYDFVNAPSQTKQEINNWASTNTEGKITNLISDDYSLQSVNFVLLSAIYFHNTWKYKFEPIPNQKFNLANGKSKDIPFMEFTQNIPLYEMHEYRCTVINLPYENEKYSMVLIVPNENSQQANYNSETNPLDQFIQQFDSTRLHEVLSTTKQKFERFIKLQIPKFSVKSEGSLVQPLKRIGITKIFGSDSDLSGITSTNMFVSDILQQATLDVDENGTIAAAATSALLIPLSAGSRPRPTTFTLNRPFIAIILDQDNSTPLFISKINNPVL